MFRKMPIILLCIIAVVAFSFPWMSQDLAKVIYAISLTFKSCIFFLLPFVIFALLCKTAIQLAKQASVGLLLSLFSSAFQTFAPL
jgi:hypothetical protein